MRQKINSYADFINRIDGDASLALLKLDHSAGFLIDHAVSRMEALSHRTCALSAHG